MEAPWTRVFVGRRCQQHAGRGILQRYAFGEGRAAWPVGSKDGRSCSCAFEGFAGGGHYRGVGQRRWHCIKAELQWKWNFQETLQAEVALPEVALPGVAAGHFYSPAPLMQSPAAEVLATSTPTPSSKAADDALVRLPVGVFVRCKRTSASPMFGGDVCPSKFFGIVSHNTRVYGGITELECIVQSIESNGKPR